MIENHLDFKQMFELSYLGMSARFIKKQPSLNSPLGSRAGSDLDSRGRLLEVSIPLFAEKGLDGVTTRDLARAAGVNISLISYYFGGKEGLYKAAILEFAQEAIGEVSHLFSEESHELLTRESYVKTMQAFIQKMVRFKFENPHMAELLLREMVQGMPYAKEIFEDLFSTMAQRIMTLMLAAQNRGIIKKEVHVHTLFFFLVHSADTYFAARKCNTPLMLKGYQFPENLPDFVGQMQLIFIQGVLT